MLPILTLLQPLRALLSPWTLVVLLLGATLTAGSAWRHQKVLTERARTECAQSAAEALQASLAEQAAAWQSVFVAHQEAVVRLSLAEAAAAADARAWRERFKAAQQQSPACGKWAAAPIDCPVE